MIGSAVLWPPIAPAPYQPIQPIATTTYTPGPPADWYSHNGVPDSIADALRYCPGNEGAVGLITNVKTTMDATKLHPCLKDVIKVTIQKGVATVETPYGRTGGMVWTKAQASGRGMTVFNGPVLQDADKLFAGVVRTRLDTKSATWGDWYVPKNPYSNDIGYLDGKVYEVYLCLYDQYSAMDPTTYPYDTSVPWDWAKIMPLIVPQANGQ